MKQTRGVSGNVYRAFFVLIAIMLTSTVIASCGSRKFKSEELILPAAGGRLEFKNGIELVVPPNALSEDTEISLTLIDNDQIKDFLAEDDFPTQPLIFFEVPGEIDLNKAVQVILPIEETELEDGWPIHVIVDQDTGKVDYQTTGITFDPEAGTLELSLEHFSTNGVAKKDNEEGERKCNDPGGACRCGRIYVESSFHDYSVGDCQSVSDEVKVQFLDCPGQPTESHEMSEFAGDCTAMGTLDFTFEVDLDGYPLDINCDGPIPFVIGSSNKILGGGPTTCTAIEDVAGAQLDILINQQISLTGEFDGQKLLFDPPQAENVSGYFKVSAMVDGVETTVIDATFGDDIATAEVGVPDLPLLTFSISAEDDYEMSNLSFSIPLDTRGETVVAIGSGESSGRLKVLMELTY